MKVIGKPLSKSHEIVLTRDLMRMAKRVQATAKAFATQAMAGNPRSVAAALKASLAREFSDDKIAKLVGAKGKAIEAETSRAWAPLMRRAGFDRKKRKSRPTPKYEGEKLIDKWTKAAAKDITSVRSEIAEAMRRDVIKALENGQSADDLVKMWRREGIPVEFGTVEGRLKTIANHQLHNLQAEVSAARAKAVGVKKEQWGTQGDSKVRPEHRALEGKVYDIDDPPGGRRPGQDPGCRCFAQAVIDDDVLSALGLDGDVGAADFEV